MADNNLALGRQNGPDIFADDDPLAELARIVGYEDRSARPSVQAEAPRREPEFNLEDELMREFERFDAPRLDPANDIGSAEVEPVPQPVADVPRPVMVARTEPAFEPQPYQAPVDRDPPLQHLPFDLSATAPSMPIQQTAPQPAPFSHADLVAELENSLAPAPQPDFEQHHVEPVQAPMQVAVEQPIYADPAPKAVEKGYKPGFRMPLANFQRTDISPREAYRPSPVEPAQVALPVAPVVEPAPVEPVRETVVDDNESIWSSLERELTGETFEQAESKSADVAPVAQKPFELPSFEMPKPVAAEVPVQPVRAEPSFDAKPTQAAASFSPLDEMIYDVDRFSSQKQVDTPAEVPSVVAAAKPAVSTDADLIDDDFELALDDLDLDFSDMSLDDEKPAPVVAAVQPVVTPAPAAPIYAPRPAEPEYRAAPVVATQTSPYAPAAAYAQPAVVAAAPAFVAPVAPAPVAEAPAFEFDADQFDPTLIADGEEQVESMAEMDVPDLPMEEPVAAPRSDPDFDIDLDAELANLLQSSAPAAPSLVRGSAAAAQNAAQARQPMSRATPTTAPVAAPQAATAPVAAKSSYDADLDDFERALEEDFRRSLSNPLPDNGRMADEDDGAYAAPVARRQISWVAPTAIAAVLLMGGFSAYAYFSSGLPGNGDNGQPLVISADKDPVKVAPENPGGKTVPNQDKAVYERVAGGANDAPRQETLISSNEEPMDVVQRTLTSDNLPLQGEEEAMTENLDTQDPRLLPQQADANGAPQGEQPVSVMPRKVRTMVVRADGTLVEQEVTAPAAPVQQAAAPAPVSEKLPAQPALAEPTVAPKPATVQTAVPAPMSTPAAPAAPAQVVRANAPAAPVPASRPAEQPVNVVAALSDRGNVQQQAPAAAPQQQVASVAPGGYYIQVASLPSQADAQKSYQNLSSKFGSVIGGRGVDIKAAEIAGKGTFYRVRIPAGSKDQAVQLCEQYRSAGGSCLVAR